MTTVYDPKTSEAILDAIFDIQLSNNGYASFPMNEEVRRGVEAAGYLVVRSTDLHGKPCYKGFTKAAMAALSGEAFAVPVNSKPHVLAGVGIAPAVDYEAKILARNDAYLF